MRGSSSGSRRMLYIHSEQSEVVCSTTLTCSGGSDLKPVEGLTEGRRREQLMSHPLQWPCHCWRRWPCCQPHSGSGHCPPCAASGCGSSCWSRWRCCLWVYSHCGTTCKWLVSSQKSCIWRGARSPRMTLVLQGGSSNKASSEALGEKRGEMSQVRLTSRIAFNKRFISVFLRTKNEVLHPIKCWKSTNHTICKYKQ